MCRSFRQTVASVLSITTPVSVVSFTDSSLARPKQQDDVSCLCLALAQWEWGPLTWITTFPRFSSLPSISLTAFCQNTLYWKGWVHILDLWVCVFWQDGLWRHLEKWKQVLQALIRSLFHFLKHIQKVKQILGLGRRKVLSELSLKLVSLSPGAVLKGPW